jgi:hypothetical protein
LYVNLRPAPKLAAGAVHAVDAADGLAGMDDFVIVRATVTVKPDDAAQGEDH